MSDPRDGRSGDSLERLAARAQRDVLMVIADLLRFNASGVAGDRNGQESFRQAINRLCDLRDALMLRDPDEADFGRRLMPDPRESRSAIWREGDRVEIHEPRWEGCLGRVLAKYPPSELDPRWTPVAIDGEHRVFMFLDHELTRIEG